MRGSWVFSTPTHTGPASERYGSRQPVKIEGFTPKKHAVEGPEAPSVGGDGMELKATASPEARKAERTWDRLRSTPKGQDVTWEWRGGRRRRIHGLELYRRRMDRWIDDKRLEGRPEPF